MVIDARVLDEESLFVKLRDIMAEAAGGELNLEILTDSEELARRVTAFAQMSRCSCSRSERDGLILLHISGCACNCGLR